MVGLDLELTPFRAHIILCVDCPEAFERAAARGGEMSNRLGRSKDRRGLFTEPVAVQSNVLRGQD